MSRAIRLALCLILVTSLPLVAGASTNCGASMEPAMVDFDLASILPSTVLDVPTTNFFGCSEAFTTATFCHQCWAALNQCSGPDCYTCTELCLGSLNCWIP